VSSERHDDHGRPKTTRFFAFIKKPSRAQAQILHCDRVTCCKRGHRLSAESRGIVVDVAFRFSIAAPATCQKCGRVRDLPADASTLVSGEGQVIVRVPERCPRCGDDRVRIRPRVKMGGGE